MKSKICLLLLFFLNLLPLISDKCGIMQAQSLGSEWDTDGGVFDNIVITGNKPTTKPITPPGYYNYDIDGGDYVECEVIGHYGGSSTIGSSGGGSGSSSANGSSGNSPAIGGTGINKYKDCPIIPKEKMKAAIKEAVAYTKTLRGTKMACSHGIRKAFEKAFGINVPKELKENANTNYYSLLNSENWRILSKNDAAKYADQGCFVIGVWNSDISNVKPKQDNGHMVLIQGESNGKLVVMDCGYGDGTKDNTPGKREQQSITHSFAKAKLSEIKYFVYKGK
ncbi:MAG: hypothetical protein J5676_04210 [Bacteroidaceae bacterium]|nr:hypothetical protein [Bacteroidaceae bacterium]